LEDTAAEMNSTNTTVPTESNALTKGKLKDSISGKKIRITSVLMIRPIIWIIYS